MKSLPMLLCGVLLVMVFNVLLMPVVRSHAQDKTDLSAISAFLVKQTTALKDNAVALQKDADAFYALTNSAKFDYAALWKNNRAEVIKVLQAAQKDWLSINPAYEQMEGIVAGIPFLSKFDPILDSGVKGEVDLNVTLPDNRVLSKPGNLLALVQEALWGTEKTYIALVQVDFDGDGKTDFGEVLPDAVYLKGFADALAAQTSALRDTASNWEPTTKDVFTALVFNLPTMTDFFNSWKASRFVLGDKATRGDFAVISRLADIHDNVGSWQVMWQGVSPAVAKADPALTQAITDGLADLKTYIDGLYKQEQDGKRFTPEQADLFAGEAQNRATVLVGQITQAAAQLNIKLPEGH